MTSGIRRQRGTTLIVALIMLVLMTLFAVSSFNTANTNLKVVGNMQQKNEALNAAQAAIESVISTPQFIANPSNAVPNPCGSANTLCTDITGTGVTEYTTRINPQPSCVVVRPIKNEELNLSNSEDLGCSAGQQQQFGVAGAVTGNSLCANTVWEITAETTGAAIGAKVTVTQGVAVRIAADDTSTCL